MRPLGLRPLPSKRREVPAVARQEYTLLDGSELEHQRVVKSLEARVLSQRENVVAGGPQRSADPPQREVRVQQQAHGLLLPEPHERV